MNTYIVTPTQDCADVRVEGTKMTVVDGLLTIWKLSEARAVFAAGKWEQVVVEGKP